MIRAVEWGHAVNCPSGLTLLGAHLPLVAVARKHCVSAQAWGLHRFRLPVRFKSEGVLPNEFLKSLENAGALA
jgi:hypothetical protein